MKIHLPKILSPIVFLIILLMSSVASAELIYYSMDQAVAMSELIVIGDTKPSHAQYPEKGNDTISVTEVLLGDQSFKGKDIVIPFTRNNPSACGFGPAAISDNKGVAVLFYKNWQNETWWPISRVYEKPEELKTLRRLTSLSNISDERTRFIEFAKAYSEGDLIIQSAFLGQPAIMEDPNSFDILIDFFDKTDPATQSKLVWTLASKNDLRALPALIKALSSNSKEVRVMAATLLNDFYPGAPGIAEAFEKHLNTEGIEWITTNYLAKRYKNKKYQQLVKRYETKLNKIRRLEKEGKPDEARKVEFELIADNTQDAKERRQRALKLIKKASSEELETIRKSMLPILEKSIEQQDLDALLENVKILRAFRHPDCLPLLLKVLDIDIWQSEVHYHTIMAIRELGEEAIHKAIARVMANIEALTSASPQLATPSLTKLLWLGDDARLQEGREISIGKLGGADYFKDLEFLLGMNSADDKFAFLLNAIQSTNPSAQQINDWIVLSIGEAKNAAATPALIDYLIRVNAGQPLANVVNIALEEIGGPQVEESMTKLLSHTNRSVRATATEVLAEIQEDKSLPLLRKMFQEENFGDRETAVTYFAKYGTPADLPLLMPFWESWYGYGKHNVDYYMKPNPQEAILAIRDKYDYDLNGPIKKEKDVSHSKGKQLDRKFAATITHDDLQQIFQIMFDTNFMWSGKGGGLRSNYIIENEFIDKSFKIYRKDGSQVVVLSQDEFNNLHITPYMKITNIEYGKGQFMAPDKNAVTISWSEQWESDGEHGFNTFIKENGKWVNLQGFAGS